jgi:hypothetical protein
VHHAGEYHWGEAFRSEISTFLQYAVLLLAFWVKGQIAGGTLRVGGTGFFKRL